MDMRRYALLLVLLVVSSSIVVAADKDSGEKAYPGADEKTPSRSEYFSWLNNTNEGATEKQTLANLRFFKWLRDSYGMALDIYAFDAGAIDGPRYYGSMDSEKFKKQFPNGFGPIVAAAAAMNTRMGLWGGPDGFGKTEEDAKARIDMMVSLCENYNWALFKFDAVCGQLRPEKEKYFIEMMRRCRKYTPDLILLNHRLKLSPEARKYSTTFLMGGKETYIDVHMANSMTCPHHRGEAISRHLPEGLTRLTEDHGVCFNSALDMWDDDLVLQAFNRCLILAPELYGNVWSLDDSEFPKLARIFNLHRRYRKILVNGKTLPESYGPDAVSRGDGTTRLITLRNLTWTPKKITVKLNAETGLEPAEKIYAARFHPSERFLGEFKYGDELEVTVDPFRSYLLLLTSKKPDSPMIEGAPYQIVREMPNKPVELRILGMPGTKASIKLRTGTRRFSSATLNGAPANILLAGKQVIVEFPGTPLKKTWHRKLASLTSCPLPPDAETLYESTVFAADNNALETHALKRSPTSAIPQVQAARDAFYNQPLFAQRAVWDRFMFDGKPNTRFAPSKRWRKTLAINGGVLRIDFGAPLKAERVEINYTKSLPAGKPLPSAELSPDLKTWFPIKMEAEGSKFTLRTDKNKPFRYLRIKGFELPVSEVYAYSNGHALDRSRWRGSDLFSPFEKINFTKAWSATFVIDEAAPGSYLCVALDGKHGCEGAYAALKIKDSGKYVGAPDRAPAYLVNKWEAPVRRAKGNTTYYIPVTKDMLGKKLEVFVLGVKQANIKPSVWITRHGHPYVAKKLILRVY